MSATAPLLEPGQGHMRALVEHAPDGIFIADAEGRYTYVNQAGCRMLGYARDELVGKTIMDLIDPKQVDRLWRSHEEMVRGATHSGEWMLRRRDGSWLSAEVTANRFVRAARAAAADRGL